MGGEILDEYLSLQLWFPSQLSNYDCCLVSGFHHENHYHLKSVRKKTFLMCLEPNLSIYVIKCKFICA